MRRLVFALVALAACGGKHDAGSRCGDAFAHLRSLDVFPAGAAKLDALGFGMACKDLTDEDLACTRNAKTHDAVASCKHAGVALLAVVVDLEHLGARGSAAGAPADLADAVCACPDEACLVQLGEARGDAVRKSGPGKDSDRLRACIAPAPPPVKQP